MLVAAIVVAGVITSWFGLADSDDGVAYATTTTHARDDTTSPDNTSTSWSETTHTTQGATTTSQRPTTTTIPPSTTLPSSSVASISACVVGSEHDRTVNVRSGPSEFTDVVGSLAEDATDIHTTGLAAWDHLDEEWRQIDWHGQEAWVHSFFLSPGECWRIPVSCYCPLRDVNVRIGPEGNWSRTDEWLQSPPQDGYAIIGELPLYSWPAQGTGSVALDYEGDTWVQISYSHPDFQLGWVYAPYVTEASCSAKCG